MSAAPPVDQVHVWTTSTNEADTAARLVQYRGLLSAEEASRCDRLASPASRARFLIARAMARTMLSRYVPLNPAAWRFRITEHGRPEIAELPPGAPDLRFNLTHTEGLVACAVVVGREIGLDVEHVGRAVSDAIVERFFSPQEIADLRNVPTDQQHLAFFDYWTLKEAYIKARGDGFRLALRQFAFRCQPDRAPVISVAPELQDDPTSWQFAQFWPTPDHRMALAVRRIGDDLPITIAAVVPEVAA